MSIQPQLNQGQDRFETSTKIEVRSEQETVSVEDAERCAHQLRKEGEKILQQTDQQMERARKAQAAASAMADQANRITEEALQRQIEGQEKFAQAGKCRLQATQRVPFLAKLALQKGDTVCFGRSFSFEVKA